MPRVTRKAAKTPRVETAEPSTVANDTNPEKVVDTIVRPVQPAADTHQWILIAPNASSFEFVKLRNPRTSKETIYGFSAKNTDMYELQKFSQGKRSWFIGDSVQSDGTFYVATHFDPLFCVLPYLIKAEYASPLDQLLVDGEFPHIQLLITCTATESLQNIADLKQSSSFQAWKYSEQKTLRWLENKHSKLVKTLEKKNINASTAARSVSFVSTEKPSSDDFRRYAFGLLSEYLDPELAKKLELHLNLPEVPKDAIQEPPAKKMKVGNTSHEPVEDYSKMFPAVNSQTKEKNATAKEKALATAAKGSKSITSFFTKK